MKYTASLGLVLLVVWLLWSGHYTPFLMSLGLFSCVFVLLMVRRMGLVDGESVPLSLGLRPLLYAPWLAWEVARANVDVARIILDPRLPIDPRMIRVESGQRSELGRVIYANSITLTPGTVSVEMTGKTITVHALTREAAEGLASGVMDRRVQALEGRR